MSALRRATARVVAVLLVALTAAAGVAAEPSLAAVQTPLQRRTGLVATIDSVRPAYLQPGKPLRITGTVTNRGKQRWTHGQAYLTVASFPATTKAQLDEFASQHHGFGTRIFAYGLFDEMGPLKPGTTTRYHLSIPYARLPIDGTAGVYHIGVDILASNRYGRDYNADATADTFVPLLPTKSSGASPAHLATLVPLTAPVLQQVDGSFVDESLGRALAPGGRLSNVIDFADAAPANTLTLAIDPALWSAAHSMANGYTVRSLKDAIGRQPGHRGKYAAAARSWLADLHAAIDRQHVVLLPWGTPDAASIADRPMPAVIDAAVTASRAFATVHGLPAYVVGWQPGGLTNRHALVLFDAAGAALEIASQTSVLGLSPTQYPPAEITALSRGGPLTTVITRSTIGGRLFSADTTAIELRQELLSESTIRSLTGRSSTAVVAAPFGWDPGRGAALTHMASAFRSPVVAGTSALGQIRSTLVYPGQIKVPISEPALPTQVLDAARRLHTVGRRVTELVTHAAPADGKLNRQLAIAGSAAWRYQPKRAVALIHRRVAVKLAHLAQVTVTTPAFVALSSATGKFPLTVTNGMGTSITVKLTVDPRNPALTIEPIAPLVLRPGEHRDIQVVGHAAGAGLTQVKVRLMTLTGRHFGPAAFFDVRATQIGLAIWVVMGVGGAVLLVASGWRIYQRIRTHSFGPRAEPNP